MRVVCLVTTQAFNEGSMDMETFAFTPAVRGYHVYQDVWKPPIGENLLLNETLTTHGQTRRESSEGQ